MSQISTPIIEQEIFEPDSGSHLLQQINDFDERTSSTTNDAEYWYEFSLLHVQVNHYDHAINALNEAEDLDGEFVEAPIQLAYIYLWENNLEVAYSYFKKAMSLKRCNRLINPGLEDLAHSWEQQEDLRYRALEIYEYLNECMPSNCDYLLYQGRLLNWMQQEDQAEVLLDKALEVCPDYFDVALILANIYRKQERRWEAIEILEKFSDEKEAQVLLGQLALYCKKYCKAQRYFQDALTQDGSDSIARRGLARSLYNQLCYRSAKQQFRCLISEKPCDDSLLSEYFYYVKPYTNWAIVPEFKYVQAKEDDPDLKAPVVRTLYVSSNLTLHTPICDRWSLDWKGIFFRQREKDIFPPTGINYNVYMGGGQLASHVYLSKNLRWDCTGKVIQAWGEGTMAFPFRERTSFEPASYIVYDSEKELFVLGGNYESFVIKNFARGQSQLQRFAYTEMRYGRRYNKMELQPEIYGWAAFSFYRDYLNNVRNIQAVLLRTKLPFCEKAFSVFYIAEHSGFKKLNPNYYSYKGQWMNTVGVSYFRKICSQGYLELLYEQRWRSTRDLFLPVGDDVFVAPKLFVRAYRPSIRLGYRIRDKVLVEVGAHYYKDTFPYRDYSISTNILWYF
jgi:tetratricopeptide (TPR) repeat protein